MLVLLELVTMTGAKGNAFKANKVMRNAPIPAMMNTQHTEVMLQMTGAAMPCRLLRANPNTPRLTNKARRGPTPLGAGFTNRAITGPFRNQFSLEHRSHFYLRRDTPFGHAHQLRIKQLVTQARQCLLAGQILDFKYKLYQHSSPSEGQQTTSL